MLNLPNAEISGELFVRATLKCPWKILINLQSYPGERVSIICQVSAVLKLPGYKLCRAFVKHALLFVMCIMCELVIAISLCTRTIELDQPDKGYANAPCAVVSCSLRAVMS